MRDDLKQNWLSGKQHAAQSRTCPHNTRLQGRLSSKSHCKQRVEKNLVLVVKEERLAQKRRKAKPKEFRNRKSQKEKKRRVERIDGEIC